MVTARKGTYEICRIFNFTPLFSTYVTVPRRPRTPMRTDTRTHTRARARTIRHACTHREAYGRCIVIRRNDCTSWCTSLCNRCASLSAITCVSTTVKARMCTGCNSIYLQARVTYVRCVNGVSFKRIFFFLATRIKPWLRRNLHSKISLWRISSLKSRRAILRPNFKLSVVFEYPLSN